VRQETGERLASWAGIVVWVAVAVPILLELLRDPVQLASWRVLLWLYAYVSYGAVFIAVSSGRVERALERYALATLVHQTAMAALAVALFPGYGFLAILFIITASHAAHVLSVRASFLWVAGQTLFIGVVVGWTYPNLTLAAVQTLAYLGFQLFALFTTHAALSEARARESLARQSAELRATQVLLAESHRMAERVRISRELHDLVGHHLTALSLNLEVASHLSEGKAKAHVDKAQALARLLLADVREVVSRLREGETLDLAEALRALVQDIPRPRIHLSIPEDLGVDDVWRAQVILRCMQEAVTNAVRHAGAENLWIELEKGEGGISVRARDDGRGAAHLKAGNGLSGMRERLEELGGRLDIAAVPGTGFTLDAYVPVKA
jgi:signal transduction histidine kinase